MYIDILWKENESDCQLTVSAYRTVRKFIFNLLVLILINLQEVVNFNTGERKKHRDGYKIKFQLTFLIS